MARPNITAIVAANIFLSGASFAAMNPYRVVVGVETLGLSNAAFGAIMALNAFGSMMIAIFLGWLSDKIDDRRVLVMLCAIGGALGFVLVWSVRTPIGFAAAFCLLIPFGNALFSQSFSYARAFYDREDPDRSQLMMSYLRTAFTLAWIIIPPLAGWYAAQTSSYAVFGISAVAHTGCTMAIALLFTQPDSRVGLTSQHDGKSEPAKLSRVHISTPHRFGMAGVALSMVALQLNMSVLPMVIMRDLNGSLEQVGITAAVAAAIEVPFIIGWGYLALRWRKERVLSVACLVFALYFALGSQSSSFLHVLLIQFFAAIAISAVISINISYLQEVIPGRVGLSTSLVDVLNVCAILGAAMIFALNPWENYAPLMVVAAFICVIGAASLSFAERLASPR